MKKTLSLFMACFIIAISIASAPVMKGPKDGKVYASEVFIPIGKTGSKISLLELSTISRSDLEARSGKKMDFITRKTFKSSQRKLKKLIEEDGTINNKNLQNANSAGDGIDGTTGFHLGGFALGFFLFLLGVLIAYLINDGKKQNRVKWAWIGAIGWLIFGGAFFFF
jgi:hypothetical protein